MRRRPERAAAFFHCRTPGRKRAVMGGSGNWLPVLPAFLCDIGDYSPAANRCRELSCEFDALDKLLHRGKIQSTFFKRLIGLFLRVAP
jgi:hypothetical protein